MAGNCDKAATPAVQHGRGVESQLLARRKGAAEADVRDWLRSATRS